MAIRGFSIQSTLALFGIFLPMLGCMKSPKPKTAELAPTESKTPMTVDSWCETSRVAIQGLKWNVEPCAGVSWKVGGSSVEGRPLVYAEFGDPTSKNVTLVFSTVHGDEITPFYLGIQLANWMKEHEKEFQKIRVVIAPLVNPDGFFKAPKTRMNARGVDVNRNFPTNDWRTHALKAWKVRFRSDPRRYPGATPRSEPETVFQEELIQKIKPQKILSIHSPLNVLDYDGPTALSLKDFSKEYVSECLKLRARLRAKSTGFFPGSLGNYAGRELGIPTLTLELPSADPRKADGYWKRFSTGIKAMIEFSLPDYALSGPNSVGG